ncbi:MAG: epoxyqueuosine reductase QueH [Lachnospiraceae bacterium]|nr:epoxyqueuosine reductase QueH [Lachnospiraceae bacterium]
MNTVRNYQKELDNIIERNCAAGGRAPTLFLHSCCAPCSSYVLAYLRRYFRITVFYFNPNITEDEEYRKRVTEQKRLIAAYNKEVTEKVSVVRDGNELTDAGAPHGFGEQTDGEEAGNGNGGVPNIGYPIAVVEGNYEPARFFSMAKGLEQCPEGGARCFACYEMRLRETARQAQAGAFDYFTTTLTISPLKNAEKLNEICEALAQAVGVAWLPSDFKKKDGYRRSVELSREYGLYRQDYCGCVYSRMERERQKRNGG